MFLLGTNEDGQKQGKQIWNEFRAYLWKRIIGRFRFKLFVLKYLYLISYLSLLVRDFFYY